MRDIEATLLAAVAKEPANAAAHSELAAHYYAAGRLHESVREYTQACELAPQVPQGHYNLAATLNAGDEKNAALKVIERAEKQFQNSALIHYGKACVLQGLGRLDEALASYTIALELDPQQADTWYGVGVVLLRQGQHLRASNYFERALDVAPHHAGARYMHDALSGQARRRPDEAFVRELFDNYAPYYDDHMLDTLGYRAPEVLYNAMAAVLGDASGLRVLDLGCGTGLAGSRLRSQAAELTGVDLSEGMLARARALDCYDRLERSDVFDYLCKQQDATRDLVIAADVFIYFADLDETFREIRRVLAPGGIFAFTVEEQQDEGWSAGPSGRFRHSGAYLEMLRKELGYATRSFERCVIRHDGGEPCQGFVTLWSA